MALFSIEKFVPSFLCVGSARADSLDLDVQIVFAAINDKVDLATVWKEVGFVRDRAGDRGIFEQDHRDSHFIDAFRNLTVIALRIGSACSNSFLELGPEYFASNDTRRNRFIIFGANSFDKTI